MEIYVLGICCCYFHKKAVASNYCSVFSEENRNLLFTYEADQIVEMTFKSTEIPKTLATVS